MLEIIKQFDARGIAMGTYGVSHFGGISYLSFLVQTDMGNKDGIPVIDEAKDYIGAALVRITMPEKCSTSSLIRKLHFGDVVQVKGFICIDEAELTNERRIVYLGTEIKLSG